MVMTPASLRRLVVQGEGPSLEFKRTTGELREGLETACGFLNTAGGCVLFGVNRKGGIEGQQVSEQTIHEITAGLDRFEPPAPVKIERTEVSNGREVLALVVGAVAEFVPFTFDGRPYERVGNTTRKMTQDRYESLLLERAHARRRWENQAPVGVRLKDLDREEILHTREAAIEHRRISAETSRDVVDILDRLGLRRDRVITQAAQVLYGTKFMPDYPQCLLKLGHFRGNEITGDILDNKQEYLHAFAMVREGLAFLDRTLPLAARFPEGKIFREDRPPIPPNALREILLNAVMHRDYSDPAGYVAIAVFDDRIEIRSTGRLPAGITVDMLAGPHLSKPRNPLIADTFHRTGAVEIWGRGTNRVIEECRRYGIPPPTFEERGGSLYVTFRAPIGLGAGEGHQVGTKSALSRHQVMVLEASGDPQPLQTLMQRSGRSDRTKFRNQVLRPLLEAGLLAMTIPDKPRSRLQRYRTTKAGKRLLDE
jgi:ATP-dependent DNA helicase RecG